MTRLIDLDVVGRRALVNEIQGWNEDVALRKGRELWHRAVLEWCNGKKVFKDDGKVVDPAVTARICE